MRSTTELVELSIIEGKKVIPPGGLDYVGEFKPLRTHLEKLGGKWIAGKVNGFVFDSDPTRLLSGTKFYEASKPVEVIHPATARTKKKEDEGYGTQQLILF